MEDPQPFPTTPTSAKFRSFSSTTPKTPLRPSPTPYQPKYSHPYGIKSTSSGVLSSAAVSSSPNNVSSAHGYQQHKSSKSMHSLLRNSSSVDDLATSAASPASSSSPSNTKQDSRHGAKLTGFKYDSIRTRKRTLAQRASMSDLATIAQDSPGGRGLECLASPRKKVTELREEWSRAGTRQGGEGLAKGKDFEMEIRELDKLPKNPKLWTTAELATYVGLTLRLEPSTLDNAQTPARDAPGAVLATSSKENQVGRHALPAAVIEEIKDWIYRRRLDGKAFLRGAESDWAVSEQAPPFLPILLSLSRHLRRGPVRRSTSLRHSAFAPDSGDDAFFRDSASSAYDRHIKDSSVLQETDENEDVQDASVDFLDDDAVISHVRQVAARFDRPSFEYLHSSQFGQEEHDIFSPHSQPTLKSRTMSFSSSHSAASPLSSDAGDAVCVRERAALFERGAVGRRATRTAEEREGRVLDRDSINSSEPLSHTGRPNARESVDLDATVKASMLRSAADWHHGDSTSKSPLFRSTETGPPPQLSAAECSNGVDLPALAVQLAAGYFDHRHDSQNSDPNGPRVPLGNGDMVNATCASAATLAKESHESASNDSAKSPTKAASLKYADEDAHPASPHMSHMAAHEKAGLKPYGALRRAHSSPVPRFHETRKLDFDDAVRVGSGVRTLHTPAGDVGRDTHSVIFDVSDFDKSPTFDPHRSAGTHRRVTTQSSTSGRCKAAQLFDFGGPEDRSYARSANVSFISHEPLQEAEEILVVAQARISALEQALAEVVQEKAVLQSRLASAEEESASMSNKPDESSSTRTASPNSDLAPSVTILWRWLTTGQSTTPGSAFDSPQSLGQLPGYVFLVGVGLSVIVARVVLSRPLARGR